MEPFLDFRIQGGASHYEFSHIASEGAQKALAHLSVYDATQSGDFACESDGRFLEYRENLALENLFHHKRHGHEQIRLHLGECGHQRRRGRGLCEPVYAHAVAERVDEFDHESVHMSHWEHGHHIVLVSCGHMLLCEVDGGREVPVGEHHSLRVACRTGGVVDGAELVEVVERVVHVFRTEALRILRAEEAVHLVKLGTQLIVRTIEQFPALHIYHHPQARHLGRIHLLPLVGIREEGDALRMVHEEAGVVGSEVREYGHNHGLVGVHSEVGHAPFRAVPCRKGNLVALGYACVFEDYVESLYGTGHLPIGETDAAHVVEGRLVPVFSGRILESVKIMGHMRV